MEFGNSGSLIFFFFYIFLTNFISIDPLVCLLLSFTLKNPDLCKSLSYRNEYNECEDAQIERWVFLKSKGYETKNYLCKVTSPTKSYRRFSLENLLKLIQLHNIVDGFRYFTNELMRLLFWKDCSSYKRISCQVH